VTATDGRPYRVTSLDDIESVPGPGTLTWHPVRATLGIRAFGTNAYTADAVGADVVEPHTESLELAHEELYFVARGRATFTIDGDTFDAPAGTYVFLPDPAAHRHAVAAEAGTTVLSFGGPPAFTPSAWEWSFRAAALRAEPERARAVLEDGMATHPHSPNLLYALACLEASQGHADAALAALERALDGEPTGELRADARDEDDFAALRDDPRFTRLTSGANSPPAM
jgi:mannose-6-phosphate isomerase-like protein (cupin superfamily)